MRLVHPTLVLAALVLAGGCYRYVPAEPAQVPRGSQVRALLTDEGVAEMTRILGPDVLSLDGPLASWDGGGVALLRQTRIARQGFPATTFTDTLRLSPSHVAGLEVRELDGKRTAFFTAGVVMGAASTVLAALIFGGTPEDPGEGGEIPPDDLFQIRIPIGFR